MLSALPPSGTIVWCRFPCEEAPNNPGPTSRPCLIVKHLEIRGVKLPGVAYGSAQDTKKQPEAHEIHVARSAANNLTELFTRFDFLKTAPLYWAAVFFAPESGYTSLVLGVLTPAERVQAGLARIAAENLLEADPELRLGVKQQKLLA